MYERKINKHSINFSQDDIETYIKNIYIKLLIERDHPEIITKAEELTRKFIEQENDQQT